MSDTRDCIECGEDIGDGHLFVVSLSCRHVLCCPCQLATFDGENTLQRQDVFYKLDYCLETTERICRFFLARPVVFVDLQEAWLFLRRQARCPCRSHPPYRVRCPRLRDAGFDFIGFMTLDRTLGSLP